MTRPIIGWADLAGARVGLWGLGVEGQANRRRLAQLGVEPVLVEDHPTAGAGGGDRPPVLATGAGGLEALAACEVVVKSPGVSRYRPEVAQLEAAGVAVTGGLGLWLADPPSAPVACITGTKGKSTTTAIAGHLLGGLGRRAVLAGNIGLPPWDPSVAADGEFWLVETSSFQATDVALSPPVVAVTSLHPDHLDWHGDAEHYFADKLSLCSQPGAALTVANGDSPALRQRADQLGPRVEWVSLAEAGDTGWTRPLGLLGQHNLGNALMARRILVALGVQEAADDGALARAAAGFAPLPSRLRPLPGAGGVTYVDDSLSTNVLPTLAALEAFAERRVALLVGGHDRGIDYRPLAEGLATRARPTLVVTMPDNGGRIGQAVRRHAGPAVELVGPLELDQAVAVAAQWARPDGVVLLSPAAPSFGRFADYRQRAAAFERAVAGIDGGAPGP